jgi:hypothetical protein
MCNVTELLRLKREITALHLALDEAETQIAALNSLVFPPSPPDVFEEIQGALLRDIFREVFPNGNIFVSDRRYKITMQSELRRFIEWDNVNIFPYVSEWHDCDDFAIALVGDFAKYPGWSPYPVALIWADYGIGPHGFAVDIAWESPDIRIYYTEPQNDYEIAAESMEGAELQLLVL